MERLNILREQANELRDLAGLGWCDEHIRRLLLDLAERCDQLASGRERELRTSSLRARSPSKAFAGVKGHREPVISAESDMNNPSFEAFRIWFWTTLLSGVVIAGIFIWLRP